MKHILLNLFSVLSFFVILISCKENLITSGTSQQFRIKKVTMQGDQQSCTDTYSYSNDGRLSSIYKAYTDQRKTSYRNDYYKTVFQYNVQGRLTSIERQPDYAAPGTIIPDRYDYEYDATGNAVVIKYSQTSSDAANNQLSKTTFSLVYNGTKFPAKITAISDVFRDGTITEYMYDQGNVVKIKKDYFDNTSSVKNSYTRIYQVDDKPNPFYNLYIGAPDPDIFSDYIFKLNTFYQNNTFSKNNSIYPNLNYEYDSNGNLIKITSSIISTYEYEAY